MSAATTWRTCANGGKMPPPRDTELPFYALSVVTASRTTYARGVLVTMWLILLLDFGCLGYSDKNCLPPLFIPAA